jgi:hypothetical protein
MHATRLNGLGAVLLLGLIGTASGAVTLPKEGSFDTNFCFSGTGESMPLTDKALAGSYRMFATVQSIPPGGAFDQSASQCIGVYHMINGTTVETGYCDLVDADGDKYLVRYSGDFKTGKLEALTGTGKYEGMVLQGEYRVGHLPTTGPDRFYNCNRYSGKYKLR